MYRFNEAVTLRTKSGIKPSVVLLSSLHAQHYNATFIVSYPDIKPQKAEESERKTSLADWQYDLLNDADGAFLRERSLNIWEYLSNIKTEKEFPGRRLSGSRYIFVPFSMFLLGCVVYVRKDLEASSSEEAPGLALDAFLRKLFALFASCAAGQSISGISGLVESVELYLSNPPNIWALQKIERDIRELEAHVSIKEMERIVYEMMRVSEGQVLLDDLVVIFTKKLYANLFRDKRASDGETTGPELVISRVARDRAYFISDLAPNSTAAGMILGIIVDLGLSRHQRGRLVQMLGDVSTFRNLVLRDMGRIRATLEGMTFTTLQLNVMQSEQLAGLRDPAQADGLVSELDQLRAHLSRLRFLQDRMLRYNLLVTYGLEHKAVSADTYQDLLEARLTAIGERSVGPHLTISDFLQRRLLGAAGNIERASKRYGQLMTSIRDQIEAVKTQYQIAESDRSARASEKQIVTLETAEWLACIACLYYLGSTIDHIRKDPTDPWSWLIGGLGLAFVLLILKLVLRRKLIEKKRTGNTYSGPIRDR